MVADFDTRHTIPNSLDDPSTLMAKHGGQRGGIQLITHDGISVTNTRSDHTQDVPLLKLGLYGTVAVVCAGHALAVMADLASWVERLGALFENYDIE
jgi:hypothetical protein